MTTHAERVPVKIGDVPVGSARINEDGTIDVLMGYPSMLGKEILKLVTAGVVKGLAIMPIIEPDSPVAIPTPRTWFHPRRNFQKR